METIFPPFPSFLLPRHAWVGMRQGLPVSSAGPVSQGPPWWSCMLALVAPGLPESLGWLLRCLFALPRAERCPSHWGTGEQIWVFARWRLVRLSVCPSFPASALCITCFLLDQIKMVNS